MTRKELIEKIDKGSDILFDVAGRHFTILTWTDKGIAIGEQNKNTPAEYFDSPEALVDNFKVDGVTLAELSRGIVITDYTSSC